MKFYEIPVGTKFTVQDHQNTVFSKVKEERISCCKVKVNALNESTQEQIVFKPMQDVEVVDN